MIIQPHKRTVFVQYKTLYANRATQKGDRQGWMGKYTLNLPKTKFTKISSQILRLEVFNENNVQCIPPFTNINLGDAVCLGLDLESDETHTLNELVDMFFQKPFTLSYMNNLMRYDSKIMYASSVGNIHNLQDLIHDFYTNWEETGHLELKPSLKIC